MSKKYYYYDVADLIKEHPGYWAYLCLGGRNTGKTYSSLRYCIESKQHFVFVKRTMDDVDLLCSGSGRIGKQHNEYGVDLSPFKSLNRDFGWNIRAFSIRNGLGGFWRCNEKNEPEGFPVGYIVALSAVQKFKGFDMSECSVIIFDEFIPQKWERIDRRNEGTQVLELYKTVSRDREHRGMEPLKLICLANAVNISNPLFNTLEITDKVVDMQIRNESEYDDTERGIVVRFIKDNEEFKEKEKQSWIMRAMGDTDWGRMALESDFAYDDFSSIKRVKLSGYRCKIRLSYKGKQYYIYMKDGTYHITSTYSKHWMKEYNLDLENDQKRFFDNEVLMLRHKCIDGKLTFSSYTLYDLIINYKKYFYL